LRKTRIAKKLNVLVSSFVLLVFGVVANAEHLVRLDYQSVKENSNKWEHFELVQPRPKRGHSNAIHGILRLDGISFGERFAGQRLINFSTPTVRGTFDVISGTPQSPLQLEAGAYKENLVLGRDDCRGSARLYGVGSNGADVVEGIGEGAVAVHFSNGQSAFGFAIKPREDCIRPERRPGRVNVRAYDRQGIQLGSFSVPVTANTVYFATGTADGMPHIFGVTLTNTDPAGLSYDDFVYSLEAQIVAALN